MLDAIVYKLKVRTIEAIVQDGHSLDVGCGDMTYTKHLPSPIGVDNCESFEGTSNCPDYFMSAMNLEFGDAEFDNVCFFDVLEHIPDIGRAISEAHRVLAEGGVLAVIDPNDSALFWVRLMALRFRDAFRRNPDHVHRLGENQLRLLVTGKFELEKVVNRVIFTGYKFRKV